MKVRVFDGRIFLDPNKKRSKDGYPHEGMNRWLDENPGIKIVHMVQSQEYSEPTAMLSGMIRFVTTVLYEEEHAERHAKRHG